MDEIWKPISGYEQYYEVSSLGRVRSVDRYVSCRNNKVRLISGKVLKSKYNSKNNGYLQIGLYKNNKQHQYLLHRLVAQAFLQNDGNLPEVNHINGDKTNNRVDNLEWINHRDNTKHSYDIGLRNNQRTKVIESNKARGKFVVQYDMNYNILNQFDSLSHASGTLNVNQSYLGRVLDTGKIYKMCRWYSKVLEEVNKN